MKLRPMFTPPEITFKMLKPQPFCLLRTKHHLVSKFQLLVELLQLHTVHKFESLADLPSRVHLKFDQKSYKITYSYRKIDVHLRKIHPTTILQNNEKNKL